jgi:hypothetical protein
MTWLAMVQKKLEFDVSDQDIEGLVLKTALTASASGLVVIEGQPEAQALAQLKSLRFFVTSIPKPGGRTSTKLLEVRPDGTFLMRGLTPGSQVSQVTVWLTPQPIKAP